MSDTNKNTPMDETPDFDTEAFGRRFREVMEAPEHNDDDLFEDEPETDDADAEDARPTGRKKKKHVFRRILLILLALILVFTGTAVGAAFYATSGYQSLTLEKNAYVKNSDLMHAPGVTNILLMGIDTKDTAAKTRSDSMILLSIDTLHRELKLTSFMRDMYVEVPGYGGTKLTHACAYEGPQLTVDTIELNFGIKIDAYCKVGYKLFVDLVNGIGGITVPEIDETESWALAKEGVDIAPGTNIHLNGHQALNYCRIRKGQSDFQRTERQREALTLIIKQAVKTNPFKLMKLAKKLLAKVECSIEKTQFISLFFKALPCLFSDIGQQQIPADGTWSSGTRDGLSVLLVDMDANKQILKEFIY